MTRPDFDQLLDTAWQYDGPCLCYRCRPFSREWGLQETLKREASPDISTNAWSFKQAITRLDVEWSGTPPGFDSPDEAYGTEGMSWDRIVWVRHDAEQRVRTAAHELAHVLLGHTTLFRAGLDKALIRQGEAEAESVALLVSATLGATEADLNVARHYIKNEWPASLPPESRERVKTVAAQILSAGWQEEALAA